MKNHKKVLFITYAAVIAALYTVLTYYAGVLNLASGVIQVRFSEALTILAAFTPAAIPGLWIGCIISNIILACDPIDIVFGSLATLIGAVGTFLLTHSYDGEKWVFKTGKKSMFLTPLPPVISNTVIVPFILAYVYHFEGTIPFFMLTVGIGEILSCYVLGIPLYQALIRRKDQIFLA